MDWEKVLRKGVSISKKVAREALNDYQKRQASAQGRLNDARSRAERLSDEELERKVMKAYKEDGRRDLETGAMVQEYMKRRNGK